jgi:hypothetical protein
MLLIVNCGMHIRDGYAVIYLHYCLLERKYVLYHSFLLQCIIVNFTAKVTNITTLFLVLSLTMLCPSSVILLVHPADQSCNDTACCVDTILENLKTNCSRSRQRAAKADKRMVLVHTHGLFIT